MLCRALCGSVALLMMTSAVAFGDAKEDLTAAIKKTGEAANYSWTSTVENGGGGGFGAGTTTGQWEKDGYTHVTMPGFQGAEIEFYIKGTKVALKGPDGKWQTPEEAAAAAGGGGAGRGGMGMFAQGYKAPAMQANDVAGKLENVKATADGFTADLNEEGAKSMMQGRGRGRANATPPEVKDPKATAKVTVKDGAVTKVVYHVTGSITFNGNERQIDRTTTVDYKDVGTTKVNVPDEVKKKLEG